MGKIMKNLIILAAAFISLTLSGCSYVTDMIEAGITERASFSADAVYTGGNVIISWDQADSNEDFVGIEIYRTSRPNDEYSEYIKIDDRFTDAALANVATDTYTDDAATIEGDSDLWGTYFYRVGIIYWDDPLEDRDEPGENGYVPDTTTDYPGHTHIEYISGYAKVVVP